VFLFITRSNKKKLKLLVYEANESNNSKNAKTVVHLCGNLYLYNSDLIGDF
jgi:hypothetical protein